MINLAILGSSGSIGEQTLNIVRRNRDKFNVVALSVNSSVDILIGQMREFAPSYVGVCDKNALVKLPKQTGIKEVGGNDCLKVLAALPEVDMVVVAVVGMCGLAAVMSALEHGKQVALANKESLVAGGRLVTDAANKIGKELLPIDSEHSAVWQCLKSGDRREVRRIILTASGGSFYGKNADFLKTVTPQMAVKHPNWNMGKKISVDSSTLMNKALEIIEARWLFDTKKIDYIIHPQSVIHSMVEFIDGSIVAQMSEPNMELPIQLALGYPERLPMDSARFAFDKQLSFSAPDEINFSLPRIAKQIIETDGNAACIFNAAGEACVNLFLNNKIGFSDISIIVEKTLTQSEIINNPTLDDIFSTYDTVYGKLMKDYN